MYGLKNLCIRMEHLRRLIEAFVLTVAKSWYPHYINTQEILYYIGPLSDVSY